MAKTSALRKTSNTPLFHDETGPSASAAPSPAPSAGGASVDAVLKAEIATYIADMSEEMSRMAKASGHHLLSYFLDMACAEAKNAAEQQNGLALSA